MQKSLIHSVVKEILSRYYRLIRLNSKILTYTPKLNKIPGNPEIYQFIHSVAKELLSQNDHLKERNSKISTYTQKFNTIPGLPGSHMKS